MFAIKLNSKLNNIENVIILIGKFFLTSGSKHSFFTTFIIIIVIIVIITIMINEEKTTDAAAYWSNRSIHCDAVGNVDNVKKILCTHSIT